MSLPQQKIAADLMALEVTAHLREALNNNLQQARHIEDREQRYQAIDRWLIALDLLEAADNYIEGLADGRS